MKLAEPEASEAHTAQRSTIRAQVRRLHRPSAATLIEFGIYLAAALLIISPVTLHLNTRIVGSGDAEAYVWLNWRVGRLIHSFHLFPTKVPDAVWPYGSGLLTSDGYLPVYVGALWSLFLAPVLAFNMSILTGAMLNFWAGRTLARRFSARRAVWIVVALAFGTAPAIALRFYGHYTFVWAFTGPLLIAAAIDTGRDGLPVRWVRLALLMYVAYLCSVFYLIFGAMAYVCIVACTRPREWRRLGTRFAAACALTLVLMSPFVVTRLQLDHRERAAGGVTQLSDEATSLSADVESVVVQPYTSKFEIPGQRGVQRALGDNLVEATIFPGFLLLLGLGAVLLLRSRVRLGLLVATLAIWLMALGPSLRAHGQVMVVAAEDGRSVRWLPFAALQALPGLGMIRTPNRASFTLAAVLAACLALGLDWTLGWLRTSAARVAIVCGCVALLATNLVIPVNWSTLESSPAITRGLREIHQRAHPGDTVVFLPADCFDDLNNNGTLQITFRIPMLGCEANFASIPWYSGFDRILKSRPLAGLRCDAGFLGRRPTPFPNTTLIDPSGMKQLHRTLGVRFYILDKIAATDTRCDGRPDAIVSVVRKNSRVLAENDRWAIFDAFPDRR